ncbi:MAG: cupin domain-containing protein [Prevotella sp.]|nr:cupin domain-containing protein [Prevotella sp.]
MTTREQAEKTCSSVFQVGSEIRWEVTEPGVERQVMGYDGQLMMVKVRFAKGTAATIHSHYHSQASCIASGKFEVTIGTETKVLAAGDGFYVAPDTIHGVVCLEAGIIIDTFSPMRATFIGLK